MKRKRLEKEDEKNIIFRLNIIEPLMNMNFVGVTKFFYFIRSFRWKQFAFLNEHDLIQRITPAAAVKWITSLLTTLQIFWKEHVEWGR